MLGKLDLILQRDGFIGFICGAKEKGKTDIALLLAEYCFLKGYRARIATNIKTDSFMIESKITTFPDLEDFLNTKGRKLFILDEAGKIWKRMRFMSEVNLKMNDIAQLIRHYDAGLVGIAPSERFIDSLFLNTDILDFKIRKLSKQKAKVTDYLNNDSYFLDNVPRTSIVFDSKDSATFTMKKDVKLETLPMCCQVAAVYAKTGSYNSVKQAFPDLKNEQIRRHIIMHIEHTQSQVTHILVE